AEDCEQSFRKLCGGAGLDEHAGVTGDLRDGAGSGGDDGSAGGESLDNGKSEPLKYRLIDDGTCRTIETRQLLISYITDQVDAISRAHGRYGASDLPRCGT